MTKGTNWKIQLEEALDKPYGEQDENLFYYMRDEASNEQLRYVVQEAERRIKAVVMRESGSNYWIFRHFSESEIDLLDHLFFWRDSALDLLMRHPTQEEIERLGYQNDKLYRLTRECFDQSRKLWHMFHDTPHEVATSNLYDVQGTLRFEYCDETSVVSMPNDDYYGSDFRYMIHLKDELVSLDPLECLSISPLFSHYGNEENDDAEMEKCWKMFDDGVTWAEGNLFNPAYDKYCICYALHALHTHVRDYCLPDILRMDNFRVQVRLKYDREECDFLKDSSDDFEPKCPKDLSGKE